MTTSNAISMRRTAADDKREMQGAACAAVAFSSAPLLLGCWLLITACGPRGCSIYTAAVHETLLDVNITCATLMGEPCCRAVFVFDTCTYVPTTLCAADAATRVAAIGLTRHDTYRIVKLGPNDTATCVPIQFTLAFAFLIAVPLTAIGACLWTVSCAWCMYELVSGVLVSTPDDADNARECKDGNSDNTDDNHDYNDDTAPLM